MSHASETHIGSSYMLLRQNGGRLLSGLINAPPCFKFILILLPSDELQLG